VRHRLTRIRPPAGRWLRTGGVVRTAAVGVTVAVTAACAGDDGGGGYGPEERSDFVEACAAGSGATEEACGCFYDRLADEVPHDRFEELDRQLRDDPTVVPDDVADMAVTCSATQPDLGG
jgi:hypothetical protein